MLEPLEDRRLLAAFVVDTLIDQNDGVGVNGVSLRDAIIAANTSAGADTIAFAPSLTAGGPVTLTLTLGELTVTDTIGTTTITSPGASLLSVSGNNTGRVFVNAAGVTSQISGLTIKDGRSPGTTGGGGVANLGTLRLIDCVVSGNTAAFGAGFSNSGTLQIDTSALLGNVATASGGGAIYNSGTGIVTLNRLIVSQNRAEGGALGYGGAIYNSSATGVVTVFSTDITQNSSTSYGGGLYNLGTMTITESSVEGNSGTYGAGLMNHGSLTIGRSTFSGNAASVSGGAIWHGGVATVTGSTFNGNGANTGGGISVNGGTLTVAASTISGNTSTAGVSGAIFINAGTVILHYALVAGNASASGADVAGAVTFGWSNLIGNGTGMTGLVNGVNGNLVGTQAAPIDPKLGPLANNGGPRKTMALLPGSPAIDADNAAFNTDGRGLVRVVYGTLDIGAFEYKAMVESLVVTTAADEDDGTSDAAFGTGTSLREAISYANTRAGADTITFAPSLAAGGLATITLTLGELQLTDTSGRTTIAGPGAAVLSIDANQQNRVFRIATSASAKISGMTIKNGREITSGGSGGGMLNNGTLELVNTVLSGNSANFGGAIYSQNSGTLVISSSTLSDNSATDGSGGGVFSGGALTVTNSTVSGNTAGSSGGGIFVEAGTASLAGSAISSNSATVGSGGGISSGGALTVMDSTISGNSAGANGGGVYVEVGTASLSGSTISGNTAASGGGGISTSDSGGILTIINSTVSGNAANDGGGIKNAAGVANFSNTLIAGNAAANPDVSGAVTGGFNLVGDGSGMTGLTHGSNGNKVGSLAAPIDPKLGPLADNGGPTLTMALLDGSPAINAGDNALIPSGVLTDQRGPGFNRIFNATVDIGAFESATFSDATPPTAKLNKTAKLTRKGTKPFSFVVVYTDPSRIDLSTLGSRNLKVIGPRKFNVFATMVNRTGTDGGNTVTVTYRVAAPKGGWATQSNGKYTIALQSDQVSDSYGNRRPLTTLGTFVVAVK